MSARDDYPVLARSEANDRVPVGEVAEALDEIDRLRAVSVQDTPTATPAAEFHSLDIDYDNDDRTWFAACACGWVSTGDSQPRSPCEQYATHRVTARDAIWAVGVAGCVQETTRTPKVGDEFVWDEEGHPFHGHAGVVRSTGAVVIAWQGTWRGTGNEFGGDYFAAHARPSGVAVGSSQEPPHPKDAL